MNSFQILLACLMTLSVIGASPTRRDQINRDAMNHNNGQLTGQPSNAQIVSGSIYSNNIALGSAIASTTLTVGQQVVAGLQGLSRQLQGWSRL